MDAGNMLKPMLARGELRLVGATTLDEYRERIEKDPALERRFQQVFVGEPDVDDTVTILRGLKERYEAHHKVTITDGALVAAATLSDRYITGRRLPDKAIDLVDEAASRLRMELDSSPVEVDELARSVDRLVMEEMALGKAAEDDPGAAERLERLRADLADRLLLYRAPILIGGGRTLADFGLTDLADAHGRWALADQRQLGSDRLEVYERA